jgi:hypothetical protein
MDFFCDYHMITFHVIKRFGPVYPTARMAGKNKKLAEVGKAQVAPTKLTWTDLESNMGLHGRSGD